MVEDCLLFLLASPSLYLLYSPCGSVAEFSTDVVAKQRAQTHHGARESDCAGVAPRLQEEAGDRPESKPGRRVAGSLWMPGGGEKRVLLPSGSGDWCALSCRTLPEKE